LKRYDSTKSTYSINNIGNKLKYKNGNDSKYNNEECQRKKEKSYEMFDKVITLDISNQKKKKKKKKSKMESSLLNNNYYFSLSNENKYTLVFLENKKLQFLCMCLPNLFIYIFNMIKKIFLNLKKKKQIMQNATWKNKILIPERDSLGLFKNLNLENWYISWMNEFNKNIITKMFYINVYLILYVLMLDFVTTYSLHTINIINNPLAYSKSLTYLVTKSSVTTFIYTFYFFLILKRKKINYDIKIYYFWTLLLCLAKLIISAFDIYIALTSLHLFISPYYIYIYIHILTVQTSILLIVRYPTHYLLFSVYIILFISFYWVFSINKSFIEFIFIITFLFFTMIYSYLLCSRTLEKNRRILFSKYELPYLLYLNEIVHCLNKNKNKKIT
ncbi:hypothetical protein HEP_00176900, partial [Hepatocystis sp. ex Piliocolobus tephrosceles]